LQQELDEEDIFHAMAGSVEILLPIETQWQMRSDVVMKCASISAEELMQAESRCLVRRLRFRRMMAAKMSLIDADECAAKIFSCQIQIVSTAAP
jgi:hypothetical protein